MALQKFYQKEVLEAGCDEAGRGCLAGAVYAAAVILDPKKSIKGLDDSKKLNEKQRNDLRLEIEEKALCFAVASYDNKQIDKVNILRASFLSMHLAIDGLSNSPGLLLIDGNRFIPYLNIKHLCIVKGDAKMQCIAAASILAKTYRDDYMKKLHEAFPMYGWDRNKAYPTQEHRDAIEKYGITPYHRLSFTLQKKQLDLF
ncbi:MAG: ribonuclease HII [Bacteroidetes bacterium]|nr:ribonuclease HII [Bacteroidota bacterium]